MINELNRKNAKEFGLEFDDLIDDFYDISLEDHRRGSSFYKKSIVEIDEKSYPHIDKQLYGFWETNEYVDDNVYGFDKTEIQKLNRVVLKEKTFIEQYWEKV